ncbi:MAG: bifunctional YncE family protein/alkaline phosphatase family protein [Actinomycetota bacterium]|nr:bifunctional YncE family protein/alkaline phosphatase family protein [Actinomycetota bacterium]
MSSRRSALAAALAAILIVAAAAAGAPRIFAPKVRATLLSGRAIAPVGRLTKVGHVPGGAAATPDGRFYWTVSTLRDDPDVRIVSVATGRVVQTIHLDSATGGIVMDPVRRRVYVAGADGIRVFRYSRRKGHASGGRRIRLFSPHPEKWPVPWPLKLAISSDGRTLLAPLNLADSAAVIDLRSGRVRYVDVGSHPHGAAVLANGRVGLVSNEGAGTVSAINLRSATKLGDIPVGTTRSHPESIAVDPRAPRAYVAVADSDQVAVLDTRRLRRTRSLSVARDRPGSTPVDVAVTLDGAYLVVAESGADELAVFRLPGAGGRAAVAADRRALRILDHEARATTAGMRSAGGDGDEPGGVRAARRSFGLLGRIPVASEPVDVDVAAVARRGCPPPPAAARRRRAISPGPAARCQRLLWTAGRGLGTGPNRGARAPRTLTTGVAGSLDFPAEAQVRALTPFASRQLVPTNAQLPPPGTPLLAGGPIKHVFYVVRENRTYDQVLGDMPQGNGDPSLTLFGAAITPNAHALAGRFGLLDRVLANSDVSTDGHYWTAAARVSDYVRRNVVNYGPRPGDNFLSISWPATGFLFDQAERQGISYLNLGETVPNVLDAAGDEDRTPADDATRNRRLANSDLGAPGGCYPNLGGITFNARTRNPVSDSSPLPGAPANTESRFDCFRSRFQAQLATNSVPALTYMVLPMDHTDGLAPGRRTPRALVAENDYALGQVVDLISRSPVWSSSAIFVVEDDSQNGADHVDAHRIPAMVISPFSRRGAVVHTRYDFPSVIRSMELILGMEPLGLFDALATPMYDVFSPTPDNAEPYAAAPPGFDVFEKNPTAGAAARRWRRFDLRGVDRIPQHELDAALWKSVHGLRSRPPPPGPNANPGQ